MGLTDDIPVYVTRKNASGVIGCWTLSAWMVILVMLLAWANVVAWGVYGLVAFVEAVA